jgi:hypothetical protein
MTYDTYWHRAWAIMISAVLVDVLADAPVGPNRPEDSWAGSRGMWGPRRGLDDYGIIFISGESR